jgi:hypothetical protein
MRVAASSEQRYGPISEFKKEPHNKSMNTVMRLVVKQAGFDPLPDAADKILEDSGAK